MTDQAPVVKIAIYMETLETQEDSKCMLEDSMMGTAFAHLIKVTSETS